MEDRRRAFTRKLDGQPPTQEQLRLFGRLMTEAFLAVRNADDLRMAQAVGDALHNLPTDLYFPDFQWSRFLGALETLKHDYPVGQWFIEQFDQITGFRA